MTNSSKFYYVHVQFLKNVVKLNFFSNIGTEATFLLPEAQYTEYIVS